MPTYMYADKSMKELNAALERKVWNSGVGVYSWLVISIFLPGASNSKTLLGSDQPVSFQ